MRTVFVTGEDAASVPTEPARTLADTCVASLPELVQHYLSGEYHR